MRATVADHVERHNGDAALFWNGKLQSLCAPHHNSAKQRAELRGYSSAVGEDGFPLDPLHPANSGRVHTPRGVGSNSRATGPGIARGHLYARPRNWKDFCG